VSIELDYVPCVGAVVRDGDGRLLLVRRARPPAAGTWSLPGGRVEPGEDDAAAVVREVREETGLDVAVGELVGTVERSPGAGIVYVINDYACDVVGGTLRAGDDASDARWCAPAEVRSLPTSPGLVETLETWRILGPWPVN
jgi:ADP-ribose pyrophosphatase YjhB (NUDIX family)